MLLRARSLGTGAGRRRTRQAVASGGQLLSAHGGAVQRERGAHGGSKGVSWLPSPPPRQRVVGGGGVTPRADEGRRTAPYTVPSLTAAAARCRSRRRCCPRARRRRRYRHTTTPIIVAAGHDPPPTHRSFLLACCCGRPAGRQGAGRGSCRLPPPRWLLATRWRLLRRAAAAGGGCWVRRGIASARWLLPAARRCCRSLGERQTALRPPPAARRFTS